MAFSATLHIQGHPKEQDGIPVVSCDFGFSQTVDNRGVPTSRVNGGTINIGLRNVNDFDLVMWMFSQQARKSGKIKLSSGMTENQSFQTLEFSDAMLVSFHQYYSEDSEVQVNLTISCRKIDIQGATFENIWSAEDS